MGGKSIAIMIANVAPCEDYFAETINTLNFASKSKLIENRIVTQELLVSDREFRYKEEKNLSSLGKMKRLSEGLEESVPCKIQKRSSEGSCEKYQPTNNPTDKDISKRLEILEKQILKNPSV